MNQNFQDLKDILLQIKSSVSKVSADVVALHAKIDAIPTGEVPTQEQWDEIKASANEIKSGLQAIDEMTADENTGGEGGTGTGEGEGSGEGGEGTGGEGTGSNGEGTGSGSGEGTGSGSGTGSEGGE